MTRVPGANRPVRTLNLLRAALGIGLVIAPEQWLTRCLGAPSGWRGRAFASLLGARHVGQAALTARRPDPRRLQAGAVVDAAHAASMVLLAEIDPRWRRAALLNVAGAVPFAVTGWRLSRAVAAARP